MPLKHQSLAAALLLLAFIPAVCPAQTSKPANATPAGSSTASEPPASGTSTSPYGTNGPSDYTPTHITSVNPPPPAPAEWTLPERIKWIAEMLLMVVAAVFAWMAVSALNKIERQTRYSEETAQAAVDAARAALLFAESQTRAERPWLLITVAPMPGTTNSFSVMATNRGRSPARVVTLVECIAIAKEESELAATPVFQTEPHPPVAPTLLLPGESVSIKSFGRDEVKTVCENDEELRRIEEWEEKIYIYGNVVYADLTATGDKTFETGWCCWYIHGRQKSGMIMAGPPEYNRHT
jgi:hypothetical protein